MAEFLIYNKDHWMDSLSTAKITEHIKNDSHFQEKYDARYQRGDIVEVRPDGFWTDGKRKGFGSHAFALVTVPGLAVSDDYIKPYEDLADPEKPITLKRRKYQMDMSKISLSAGKKVELLNIADAHIIDKSQKAKG